MKQHIVISAVGGDRVGMVHELSKAVADCGGSISESRMTSLGNEFAMLLLVNGNWHTLAKLEGEFKKLADATGMNIQLRRTEERAARNDMLPYSIDVVCLDQTGIVAGPVRLLRPARRGHRRVVDPLLCGGAHRRADVLRTDDRERPEPTAHRRAARGVHGFLRSSESGRHLRAGQELNPPSTTMSKIAVGKKAPAFTLEGTAGNGRSRMPPAQRVVIYFYPRDNTPGCTQEGQSFAAAFMPQFKKLEGLDRRDLARTPCRRTRNSRSKMGFPFELLSDADRTVCKLYDVIQEKSMYGKKYMGVERSTFLIDAKGVLRPSGARSK